MPLVSVLSVRFLILIQTRTWVQHVSAKSVQSRPFVRCFLSFAEHQMKNGFRNIYRNLSYYYRKIYR